LDFGGSLTKGIAIDKNLVEHPICMEPEVISLPTQAIKDYEAQKIGSPVPLDSAWVSVDSDSYAVGYLARSRFNANAGLSGSIPILHISSLGRAETLEIPLLSVMLLPKWDAPGCLP